MHEDTIDTGDIQLHYAQWTDGAASATPLVLLHGVTQSLRYWTPVVDAIGAERRVFALDSRGHGRSGRVENGYRFIDYPRDQQAFLREVVREPAILIGHSLGGMNAVYIAAETPELVRAIVLEDPPLYFSERGMGVFEPIFRGLKALAESDLTVDEIAARLPELTRAPPAFARYHAECLMQLDPQTLGQALDGSALAPWNTDELLARITCPVLLLFGETKRGGALDVPEVQRAERKLAHCRTVFVKGVGHMLHVDRPEIFAGAVRKFLTEIE
ncbi:MAG: alpha/beta fold hydrolase [Gammaproteobacteria bacterium]